MRWMIIGSLFGDSKIALLVNLIIFTVVIAIVLILLERRIMKKKETKKEDDLLNYKISEFVSKVGNGSTPSERLSIINSVAKSSFSEWFGVRTSVSYTYLSNYFEKRGLEKYKAFSDKMFELFYSTNSYSFAEVDRLTKLFVGLIRETFSLKKAKITASKVSKPNSSKVMKREVVNKKVDEKEHTSSDKKVVKETTKEKSLTWSDIKFKKEVEKKQKAVVLQRRRNIELMKAAEDKLKEQKKLEEQLKKSLEEKELDISKKKEKVEVPKIKKKELKVNNSSSNKKTPKDFTKWHQEIDVEPMMGKSWLKENRKRIKDGEI